jgi:hypothetical protein
MVNVAKVVALTPAPADFCPPLDLAFVREGADKRSGSGVDKESETDDEEDEHAEVKQMRRSWSVFKLLPDEYAPEG